MRTYQKRHLLWIQRLLPCMVVALLPMLAILLLVSTAVALPAQDPSPPPAAIFGDLGDAPVASMTAYTRPITIPANFPTIYVPGTQSGPFHRFPKEGPYLGNGVSEEVNAHLKIGEDIEANINLTDDKANADREDSKITIQSLIECQPSPFTVEVTTNGTYTGTMFLSVWMDFDRNGIWGNTAWRCDQLLSEWAVQNEPINLVSGTYTYTVNLTVMPYHPNDPDLDFSPLWMRVTLSDTQTLPPANGGQADGSGPPEGYLFGETEDYLLIYRLCDDDCLARAGWQG